MLSIGAKICNEEAIASTGARIYKRRSNGPLQGLGYIKKKQWPPARARIY